MCDGSERYDLLDLSVLGYLEIGSFFSSYLHALIRVCATLLEKTGFCIISVDSNVSYPWLTSERWYLSILHYVLTVLFGR